ncbi:decapping and exoribonuclease protein isoform X5 [Rhipicephalus microplus]|uniref:decapping and exoribonuclease protein isoform X5 n=1 Tax=Rhipicephalus microplus TaxID=6941 RepID=UPI003F6B5DD7
MESCCSSTAMDPRYHVFCGDPAGEEVAAMSVCEAFSSRRDDTPRYALPREIGHYSLLQDGEDFKFVDGDGAKRYLRRQIPFCPMWNLNDGYAKTPHVNWISLTPAECLLRWIIRNKDKAVTLSTSEGQSERVRTDFVGHRLCLCVLMCTPYDKTTAWRMVASRHRGVIYLRVHPTKTEVHEYLKGRKDNCFVDRTTYWGIKFHRIMSPTEPCVAPEEGELVREGDSYNTVLRGQIGMHTFVISGEVKAVDPSVQCEPGSTASYVEFKTNRVFSAESHRLNFLKHKLLSWWAKSRIGGVPRGLCGFRDDNGIVRHIQEFDVSKMPGKAKGLWSEDVCMQFLDDALNFIRQHVEGDDGRTVYLFTYEPSFYQITCKRLVDPGKLYSLPDWFLKSIEGS